MEAGELARKLRSSPLPEAVRAALEASQQLLGERFRMLGLHHLRHLLEGSVAYSVEVRGVRERVYSHYSCLAEPYIAYELRNSGERLDILLAYTLNPPHPSDPWLPPTLRREPGWSRLCVLHARIDADYKSETGEAERIAREGLIYLELENPGEECSRFRSYAARWYLEWAKRQASTRASGEA